MKMFKNLFAGAICNIKYYVVGKSVEFQPSFCINSAESAQTFVYLLERFCRIYITQRFLKSVKIHKKSAELAEKD